MSFGVIMLLHAPFGRAADVLRYWSRHNVPVVVHIDKSTPAKQAQAFKASMEDLKQTVLFAPRFTTEWGRFGLVEASLAASKMMLEHFPQVQHVLLTSGSCLPLRPIEELRAYLEERQDVDIIESARTSEVPWTVGGLSRERFSLYFPFSWRRHRWIFDKSVLLQRRLKVRRRLPEGLDPHLGSQWWCLTRATLSQILSDPNLPQLKRYFRLVWIPDESFFQSVVRQYAQKVESSSLTVSKFDANGRPAIFYDDHLALLQRSKCFIARKIWHKADRLYTTFLGPQDVDLQRGPPDRGRIDRLFSLVGAQRASGRSGLYMQSRFPTRGSEKGASAAVYNVIEGLDKVFEDFEPWLQSREPKATVHGHLFAEQGAEFAGRVPSFTGGLSATATIRDYNPEMFLRSLLWNMRSARQIFMFGPQDRQKIIKSIAEDLNARIVVISGAWILPLLAETQDLEHLRRIVGKLQVCEERHLEGLRASEARAQVQIWTLAEFLQEPRLIMEHILQFLGLSPLGSDEALPKMRSTEGLVEALIALRNLGMHPYLVGDVTVEALAYHAESSKKTIRGVS